MRFASKIGISAAIAALIVGPLLGVSVFYQARHLLQERIVQEQVQIAARVMQEINNTLLKAKGEIDVIAADNFLREYLASPSEKKEMADTVADELEERAELTGPWNAMSVFNGNGKAVFTPVESDNIGTLDNSPLTRIAFYHALRGENYTSDQVIFDHTSLPVVIFAAPVFDRNDTSKVVGVVMAHYVWAPIQNILDHVEKTAIVHLFNSKGTVIGKRSDDNLHTTSLLPPFMNPVRTALPDEEAGYAFLPSSTHGGGASLAVDLRQKAVAEIRNKEWTLMLEMPLDLMFTPIVVLAKNIGLLVFGMLLVVALLFSIFGRRFLRPLDELVEGVRWVEQGHLDHKVLVHSMDEFGVLADSFNSMVDRLRETQNELVQKGKLAMLGQVAGSVGHELRNPLGVMSNAVYFLQTILPDADESVKEYLEIIKHEIAGSERIVSDLLDSVRTKPPHPEAVGVAELLVQTLDKLTIPSSVTVKLDISETLPPLRVDAQQIHQVLRNLISNGIEAMPEGGMLEISAVSDEAARQIAITVRDSGIGITPEILPKLFQPLFTTKARGIGLGLVVVKNLTEANGGTVKVQSEAGKGSVFSVTLPTIDERSITI